MFLLLKQKADTLITLLLLGNKSLPHLFMIFSIASHVFYPSYAAESTIVRLDIISAS